MSDLNFQPLLFGGDINVYSVARAFHEAYGVRSIAFGKYPSFPCHGSAILDYRVCPTTRAPTPSAATSGRWPRSFLTRPSFCWAAGTAMCSWPPTARDQLPDNVAAPYIDGALLDTLINKEKFYQLCDRYGIDHPATFIYDKSMGHDFTPALWPALTSPSPPTAWPTGPPGSTRWPRSMSVRAGRSFWPPWMRSTPLATPTTWSFRSSSPGTTPICGC